MPRKRQPSPSEVTDAHWEIVEPVMPVDDLLGRLRDIVTAMVDVRRIGCPWRSLPTTCAMSSAKRSCLFSEVPVSSTGRTSTSM